MAIQEPLHQTSNIHVGFDLPKQPIKNVPDSVTYEDHSNGSFVDTLAQGSTEDVVSSYLSDPEAEQLDNPDTTQLTQETFAHRKKIYKWMGAGAFAGLLVAGGAFLLKPGDDEGAMRESNPTDVSTTFASPNASSIIEPEVKHQEEFTFNSARILPGEQTISATRPNGEVINVPTLRETDDPSLLFESITGLMACYLTTGNQQCLDELTTIPGIRSDMEEQRQHLTKEYLGHGIKDLQVAFHTDKQPDKPLVSKNPITNVYQFEPQAGSAVYVDLTSDEIWQGSDKRDFPNLPKYELKQFNFEIGKNTHGKPEVKFLTWNTTYA